MYLLMIMIVMRSLVGNIVDLGPNGTLVSGKGRTWGVKRKQLRGTNGASTGFANGTASLVASGRTGPVAIHANQTELAQVPWGVEPHPPHQVS